MNFLPKNLVAGIGGAITLNVIHQVLSQFNNTPRIDLVGEEALQKSLAPFDAEIKDENVLFGTTLAADVVSNAAYYSTIGLGSRSTRWAKAIGIGLAAGLGAVTLPEKMGLDDEPVAKNNQVKLLTVAYYLTGALVTAGILELMDNNGRR